MNYKHFLIAAAAIAAPLIPAASSAESGMEIEGKVRDIIIEILQIEPSHVYANANLIEDLGMDSLDSVELKMALEDAFDIYIPEEVADHLNTVGDCIYYIQQLKGHG